MIYLIYCKDYYKCHNVPLLNTIIKKERKNQKIELSYDPAISLVEIYPKECKSAYNKGTYTPVFIAALCTIAKLWKWPRCSILMK
jgi:hypothetical protein